MKKQIPIFPLSIIVFPNSRYPLHIFEERYKKLINRCIVDKTGFGIIAHIENEVTSIGVYVEVLQILRKYGQGEMDIVVQGKHRFIRKELKKHTDGYYIAEVDSYNDSDVTIDESLFGELKVKVKSLLEQVDFNLNKTFWKNVDKAVLKSFKIAEKSGLNLTQQQEILLLQTENKRLRYLVDHFNKLEEKLEENLVMREIVLGDGYLNEE